jgi:two-component system cell cycle response regulator
VAQTENPPVILVVDDDERIRRALVTRLQHSGFATRDAADGEAALAICRAEATRPDLVILDVMMPGKDGYQVCQELKGANVTRGLPVILLTALDGEDERSRGARVGADEFMTKPFNSVELLARIRLLLGMRQMERLAEQRATVEEIVDVSRQPVPASGACVMVLEDDDAQRQLYATWLTDEGHEVRVASTLEEGLQLLASTDFDLLIVDVLLPDGDGRDLVRQARQVLATAEVPILLLTHLSDIEEKLRGFEAGADDYLVKPIELPELRARVTAQLRRRSAMVRLTERLRAAAWRAVTDSLTGAYGRSFFDAHLRQQVALARRFQRPVSVLMLDIDHFKRVNDAMGHLAGDEVLRGLAERLRKRLRMADVLCRYGGEEFVVIFPETSLPSAVQLAEELRDLIGKTPFRAHHTEVPITISIGVACARGGTPEALVHAADRALYRAKEMGRNRVEVGTVEAWTAQTAAGDGAE